MTWFTQNPWPVVVLSIVAAICCFLLAVRTGNRRWLPGIAACLLIGLLALVVDRLVVTDHEAVSELIEAARNAVEANDIDGVLAHVDPQAEELRGTIRSAMSAVVIHDANVGDLEIRFGPEPDTAHADFLGNIDARDRSGQSPYNRLIQRFDIELRRREGRWWMTGMQMREPIPRNPGTAP